MPDAYPTPDRSRSTSMYLAHIPRPVIWVPYGDTAVAAVPKCAQTTLHVHAQGPQIQPHNVGDYAKRLAFIRDPLERLESCFHYFKRKGRFPQVWDTTANRMKNLGDVSTIERFIDLILAGKACDKHWAPQSELLEGVEDVTFRHFEEFGREMAHLGMPNTKLNSSGVPTTGIEYRIDELSALYEKDLALRESI